MLEVKKSVLTLKLIALLFVFGLMPSNTTAKENTPPKAAQGMHIVATIKPLYLLVKELAAPSDTVTLLLPANSSPHHYQLSISDRKLLSDADMVVWVGPELETFLAKTLQQKPKGTVFTLGELDNINWPIANHDHGHDAHGHQHDRDPHLWLDPYNLGVIAQALSAELARQAPSQTDVYAANRDVIQRSLAALDKDLQARLKKVADSPFIVMHPAYEHLVQRYALNQQEFIVLTPERGIGAKHLYQLKSSDAKCVFGEVGQNLKLVNKVAGYADAKVGVLDPLGFNLSDGAPTTAVISALANTLIECLSSAQ